MSPSNNVNGNGYISSKGQGNSKGNDSVGDNDNGNTKKIGNGKCDSNGNTIITGVNDRPEPEPESEALQEYNCAKCGVPNAPSKCSRCGSTWYCNVDCQKADWKHHKKNVCLTTSSSNNSNSTNTAAAAAATKNKISNEDSKNNNQETNDKFKCRCKCKKCKTGNCHCSAEQPMMNYTRDQQGRKIFMGNVIFPGKNDDRMGIKLDDPRNVDGPGHVIEAMEGFSELVHYGNPPAGFVEEFGLTSIQHLLRDCSSRPEPTSGDNAMRVAHQGGELVRYPFYDSWEVNPPYCLNPPPKVRSHDWVWVVAEQQLCCERQLQIERFWVEVVSVTASGIITGNSLSTLYNFPIHEGDWVYFPITCVLDVEHKKHWTTCS